jgi:undecaprenyl-diphosphatase
MISLFEAIILGVLQGITEFIPISSSGHLVIMKNLFGLTEPDLFFDVMVHLGTLIPILLVFKKDLDQIFRKLIDLIAEVRSRNQLREMLTGDIQIRLISLIGVAIFPSAIIGIFFKGFFEKLFASVFAVGVCLILTGILLSLTRVVTNPTKQIEDMTFFEAIVIGFFQALAIAPGISRSGATISIALILGINRELAGRFSFLIFIPAILGAFILNFTLPESYALDYFSTIVVATTVAAIAGYFALKVLLRFVYIGKIYLFSPYCYGIGLFAILFGILK